MTNQDIKRDRRGILPDTEPERVGECGSLTTERQIYENEGRQTLSVSLHLSLSCSHLFTHIKTRQTNATTWSWHVQVMMWSNAGWKCCILFSRMIHWAGRIEKELEKVLQHVTGTQQMRSVSWRHAHMWHSTFSCIINQQDFIEQGCTTWAPKCVSSRHCVFMNTVKNVNLQKTVLVLGLHSVFSEMILTWDTFPDNPGLSSK